MQSERLGWMAFVGVLVIALSLAAVAFAQDRQRHVLAVPVTPPPISAYRVVSVTLVWEPDPQVTIVAVTDTGQRVQLDATEETGAVALLNTLDAAGARFTAQERALRALLLAGKFGAGTVQPGR